MRRFGIAPDGAITQPDRQQGTWVYAGISPEQPGPVPTIDVVRTHPVTRTITRTHHMS